MQSAPKLLNKKKIMIFPLLISLSRGILFKLLFLILYGKNKIISQWRNPGFFSYIDFIVFFFFDINYQKVMDRQTQYSLEIGKHLQKSITP